MRGCVNMKKLVKSLLVVGASLVAANSAVASMMDDFCPYAGIDYKQRWMRDRHLNANNGNGCSGNSLYGATIYLGSKWDCFGLETGLEWATRNRRSVTFNNGSTASARVNLWGWYLDALAYIPVADCVDVFGGFGVGVLTPKLSYTSGRAVADGIPVAGGSKSAAVARLRLGARYMVSECVGIRGVLGWESTENLAHRVGSITRYNGWGNSFTAQAGVFFNF